MPVSQNWRVIAIGTFAADSDLELSAIQLYGQAQRVDAAATISSSHAPTSGVLNNLSDGNISTTCRFAATQVRSPGFWLQWNFASDVDVTGIALGGGSTRSTFVSNLTIQYLKDGVWLSVYPLGGVAWPGSRVLGDVNWFDTDFDKVALLLRGDGSIVVDESPVPMSLTMFGATATSAAQSKYGGKSITFATSGTGNYLQLAEPSKLAFGSRDFTFEAWCYYVGGFAASVEQLFYHNYLASFTTDSVYIGRHPALGSRFSLWAYNVSTSGAVLSDPNLPPDNGWVHYAICRSGSQFLLLRNYQVVSTASFVGALTGATVPYGFVSTGVNGMRGFLDDLRVTMGVCRYPQSGDVIAHAHPPSAMLPMPIRTKSVRAGIAASADIAWFSMAHSEALSACDVEFGGRGRYPFKVEGLPTTQKARVTLLRARDKLVARETWSAPDGSGEFTGLDMNTKFIALAQDSLGMMHPVGAEHFPELPGGTP